MMSTQNKSLIESDIYLKIVMCDGKWGHHLLGKTDNDQC